MVVSGQRARRTAAGRPGEVVWTGYPGGERIAVGDRVRVVASGGEPEAVTLVGIWTHRRCRTRRLSDSTRPPPGTLLASGDEVSIRRGGFDA